VIFVSTAACSLISLITKDPVVYYLGGCGWPPPYMIRKVKKFLACSHHVKKDFKKLTGFESEVIPYGINLRKFKKKRRDKKLVKKLGLEKKTVLVAAGRLSGQKGFNYLLEALRGVKKKRSDFKLLLVGGGEDREKLEQQSKELGLTNEVVFLGKIPHHLLPKYYNLGDVFVLPSLFEGFGIVFLEAMACELPIISTTAGAIPEVVVENTGILVRPKNTAELQNAILRLMEDEKLRKKMGSAGRKTAKKFDWNIISARMLQSFKAVQKI
jgi:glycosyltransferase involved in cell wall biosynthesis